MANPSSLSAWLTSRSDEQLADLLRLRGDVLRGRSPRTVLELAEQLQHPHSVYAAARLLTVPELQTAEALVALGEQASRSALSALLGSADVDEALAGLGRIALVWPSGDRLRLADPLRQVFPRPLGLDPPARVILAERTVTELQKLQTALRVRRGGNKAAVIDALCARYSDAAFVRSHAAAQPDEVRDLLARRAEPDADVGGDIVDDIVAIFGKFDQRAYSQRIAAEDAAAATGLLIRASWGRESLMPAEVALALRGPEWHAPFAPLPPEPARLDVTAAAVAQEASAALSQFAEQAAATLAVVAEEPLTCVKSGGVGAREITRLAKRVVAGEDVVRLVLELASGTGLVTVRGGHAMTTGRYDTWRDREPAKRVAPLLTAWWAYTETPTVTRDRDGKALPTLAGRDGCAACRDGRQMLMQVLAELLPNAGSTPDSAGDLAWWRRPNAHYLLGADGVTLLPWREAELLGVLAHGALSPAGAALVAGDDAALAGQLDALLPRSARTATFGSDLTVLVAGSPSASIRRLLDDCADREGRGAAATWRFSPASVRRALDAGHTAAGLTEELTAVASGPLPQPLRYLIADVGRRHGHLRVTATTTCVLAEDPALLAEVAVHRGLRAIGPRLLAPTVLACSAPAAEVLTALRRAGYLPVAADESGQVVIERSAPVRAARPAARRTAAPAPAPVDALAVARALRHPKTTPAVTLVSASEHVLAQFATALRPTEVRELAHAVDHGEPVLLDYVSRTGGHSSRVVSDLELDPPYLSGWCHLREGERMFTLSRIRSVSPA